MPKSWINALNAYWYHVDLTTYEGAKKFPGFFNMCIAGDRESTIAFENHYRETAPTNTEPFFEVVYWKLYSQQKIAQAKTNGVVEYVQRHGIAPDKLWDSVQQFVVAQKIVNLRGIRELLGFKTPVLAVPLTFPALASPWKIPMIDNHVANWVNCNYDEHNANRSSKLTQFKMKHTSLRDDDFPSYLNWVAWCQEVAQVLKRLTELNWRARDVEMAVFTAKRSGMRLNVLP
jgi:hypothetical protein